MRPTEERPASVRPHLEPLSAPEVAPAEEANEGPEEEEEAGEDPNQEGEEKRRSKARAAPEEPSEKDREEHEMTHLPYQAWCPHCVAGKAPNEAHRKQEAEEDKMIDEGKVLRIGIDFWFMTDEENEKGQMPFIIMVDKQTKCHVSYPLGSKAVNACIVKKVM